MTRIPPSLLYLTIYNATLRPSEPCDDEDAEEQAHILFYTSKERAVSRDRILRQVGLARALANFSEQFSSDDPCNSVHSQCRRMIMVSPEADFWIHACIDLAKVPRAPDPKGKSKVKLKDDKEKGETVVQYDYDDGSIHDGAVRARIMKGYESFKLTHGSFASILAALGQQALELQLERFWTVWAWSWDTEARAEFGECFGPQLHPYFLSLIPIVNKFAQDLSPDTTPVILSRPYIIPSTRYSNGRHPSVLAHHLSSLIPRPSSSSGTVNTLAASVETIRGRSKEESNAIPSSSQLTKTSDAKGGNFMMGVKMDMRKWAWPDYLTFGRGSVKPSVEKILFPTEIEKAKAAEPPSGHEQETSQVEVEVDPDDLQDAITSDSMSLSSRTRRIFLHEEANDFPLKEGNGSVVMDGEPTDEEISSPPTKSTDVTSDTAGTPPSTPPLPEFSLTRLYIAPCHNPTATKRISIHYFIRNGCMLAMLHMQEQTDEGRAIESADLEYASENVTKLFDDIETITHDLDMKGASAAKVPQIQDQYLISAGQYTLVDPGFTSDSGHLFNAKAILDNDTGIHEVFSRGQNPQHWHIAKRGLGISRSFLDATGVDDVVFMEVFRKETSLTDVDNVLIGAVKKSGIADGYSGSK